MTTGIILGIIGAVLVLPPLVFAAYVGASMLGLVRPDFTIGTPPYLSRWQLTPWGWLRDQDPAGLSRLGAWALERTRRWWNVRLHCVHRSDDDRALHDHPFDNASLILRGSYAEHTLSPLALRRWRTLRELRNVTEDDPRYSIAYVGAASWNIAGTPTRAGVILRTERGEVEYRRRAGSFVRRDADEPHRLVVLDGPVWSLFFTGPKYREWGFHCPRGWRHWTVFTTPEDGGANIGRGCD